MQASNSVEWFENKVFFILVSYQAKGISSFVLQKACCIPLGVKLLTYIANLNLVSVTTSRVNVILLM